MSIASHRRQHERSKRVLIHRPPTTNRMPCRRPWVLYQYVVQVQPSLLSRNANPTCQSLRIGGNTSDPKASSTEQQQPSLRVALVLGCCINTLSRLLCPGTAVLDIAECKSILSIASHMQKHERSTCVFTEQQQPSLRVALVLLCCINTLSRYSRP
jgi:hypothetical protein